MTKGGALRLLRIAVAVGLTAFVLWRANPGEVWQAAASADWRWVAASVALVLLDRALMAYRWMVLLCALSHGSRPPFAAVLRIFFVSTFVGSFLPSVAGDMYRAYSLSRLRVSVMESAASVIMDRALGVLSMVLVAVVALSMARNLISLPGVLPTVLVAALGCALAAGGLYNDRLAAAALALSSYLPGAPFRRMAAGLIEAVRRYTLHHRELTTVLAASIAVQLLRVVQAWCLGVALGISLPIWMYLVFIPLVVIVMQIPITVSGLGTGQAMFGLLFTGAGVASADAIALSILFVALGFVGNLPGALLYASRKQEAAA